MAPLPAFADLARRGEPALDELSLALAAEFGPVDADGAGQTLDELGAQLAARVPPGSPAAEQVRSCARLLGTELGFTGDRRHYDAPENSMLDQVLVRRRGLPILLSVVYVEVARRAGIGLAGVGLAGHFVVGHFGTDPPLLLDPFDGGARLDSPPARGPVRPWPATAIATRMLSNLVGSYARRGDLARAIRAAEMRMVLPGAEPLRAAWQAELTGLRAQLN